jgi:hypothetical protein
MKVLQNGQKADLLDESEWALLLPLCYIFLYSVQVWLQGIYALTKDQGLSLGEGKNRDFADGGRNSH